MGGGGGKAIDLSALKESFFWIQMFCEQWKTFAESKQNGPNCHIRIENKIKSMRSMMYIFRYYQKCI